MVYFVPAWYRENEWSEREQSWQERRMHTEFDDTVKHMQLFHRSQFSPYRILLLGHAPNFRHFLHRQSVYHAPYWSCFDAIQEIQRRKVRVFSFHSLTWPEDIEYLYTPFVVVAMRRGKKYAQLEFGEDGNLIRIDMYQDEQICRRNIYDDRGFVSATVIYEDGKPVYRDYLMENGVWKLRYFESDGHVEINPKYPDYLLSYGDEEQKKRFSRLDYDCLEEVIEEVFLSYVRLTEEKDIFCVAMHGLHVHFIEKIMMQRKTILSFYMDRYRITEHPEVMGMIREANYIITDSQENTKAIVEMDRTLAHKIMDITPYDSRVDPGISRQLSVQKILVAVDGIEDDGFVELVVQLGKYLLKNNRAEVHLLTRKAEYDRPEQILSRTASALKAERLPGKLASRFFAEQCVDELTVSKCMREQILLVDLRKLPELYLQITAISMGIPQIVCRETQFIEDGKNGRVLKNTAQLPQCLDYYLDGLANWNQAVVASYEIGKRFTTSVLLDKWREVIEFVG